MRFRKVRLQPQSFVGSSSRFFTSWRQRVPTVIHPAFNHGETGESSGKVWIELRCVFEKLLGLQRSVAKHIWPGSVVVRLNEEQIRVWILRRSTIDPRFFAWRKLGLQRRGDFLREISLDRKNVSQIAIVVFCPNVLVIVRID